MEGQVLDFAQTSNLSDVSEAAEWFTDEQAEALLSDDWPLPFGWKLLILPMRPKATSEGGIAMTSKALETQMLLNCAGKVIAMGELAYKSPRFAGIERLPQVGDFVVYGRYAGQRLMHHGIATIQINDDEVLSILRNPEALHQYL